MGLSLRGAARLAGVSIGAVLNAIRQAEDWLGEEGSAAEIRTLRWGLRLRAAMGRAEFDALQAVKAFGKTPRFAARWYEDRVRSGAWEVGEDPEGDLIRWSRFAGSLEVADVGERAAAIEAIVGGDGLDAGGDGPAGEDVG